MTRPRPRDVLLAKAIGFYAAHGVGDTSLRTLASSIGTSQRMLHYHFGSREDLLAAVIESVVTDQIAMLDRLFAEVDDPFEAGRRNWEAAAASAQTFGPLFFELASHAMRGRPYAVRLGEVIVAAHVGRLPSGLCDGDRRCARRGAGAADPRRRSGRALPAAHRR